MNDTPQISVIVAITEEYDDFEALNAEYLRALHALEEPFEIIYVLDVQDPHVSEVVARTLDTTPEAKSITLSRTFGDSTALKAGVRASVGERLLVLPPYPQIEPADVTRVLAALDHCDMAVAERDRSGEPYLNRLHGRVFNSILAGSAPSAVKDMGCEVRAFTRRLADEVPFYGDQHRYLPVLAYRMGFDVQSVTVGQAKKNRYRPVRSLGKYTRSLLDVLNIVFLTRFTKKPLRFFGLVGLTMTLLGGAVIAYVVIERLFFGVELASRPALVMGALMLVVGLQILGIGLIGEIVVFSHARDLPEYYVKEVVQGGRPVPEAEQPAQQDDAPVPELGPVANRARSG